MSYRPVDNRTIYGRTLSRGKAVSYPPSAFSNQLGISSTRSEGLTVVSILSEVPVSQFFWIIPNFFAPFLPMLPNMMGGKLRFTGIVFGCCLWTTVPGCLGHRTGQSSWIPVNNHFSWLQSHSTKDADVDLRDVHSAEPKSDRSVADDKPELLAWRSRLKGYRLGARLAHSRDWLRDRHPDQTIPSTSTHQTAHGSLTASPIPSADDSPADEVPMPSLENGELQLPVSVGLLPQRIRPDLAVD